MRLQPLRLSTLFAAALIATSSLASAQQPVTQPVANEPRLTFQSGAPWSPRVNINSDNVMVYGIDPITRQRIASWKNRGYTINVMTGVAWGQYQDYVGGKFDGINHEDEAQVEASGKKIDHGHGIWYMSPGPTYGKYLSSLVKKAIDAGAESIYLEEPEFWVRAGYEPQFKKEWKNYYNEDWIDPQATPDGQYRASKLKYFLYRRALADIFSFVRDYSKSIHRDVKCYVATHSLINYAQWGICSPESSLLQVGCDGYIAQVWTGTSRTANWSDNVRKQRTFETAFLEYGQMQNLVKASGREMWFLNDPVEDNPRHTWEDYRTNWECTMTASLLSPDIYKYETMPWPERIFGHRYPLKPNDTTDENKVRIPHDYEIELQAVIHALRDMKQPASAVKWSHRGTSGVGLLVSDTLMFQRIGKGHSDVDLSSFFGLALPLVDRGIPVEPVQMEDIDKPDYLSSYRMLVLTYEGQKPPRPQLHDALANWVKTGGTLVVIDDDKDPYNSVREWWNTGDLHDATPRLDLFRKLGLSDHPDGIQHVGKGSVLYSAESPNALAHRTGGAAMINDWCKSAAASINLPWEISPALVLHRGPFIIAAALADSPVKDSAVTLTGRFVPLYDPQLPVVTTVELKPGQRQLLVDLDKYEANQPNIVAASCRTDNAVFSNNHFTFTAAGIGGTTAVLRIQGPQPKAVMIAGKTASQDQWTYHDSVLGFSFPNEVDPVQVQVDY